MFGLGFSELVLLGLIGLIFIKPEDLPKIARSVARFINDLKRASGEVSRTFLDPVEHVRDQLNEHLHVALKEPLEKVNSPSESGKKTAPEGVNSEDAKVQSADSALEGKK